MFPDIKVRRNISLVPDGKYITSVGGIPSYEPELYLVEMLYSRNMAENIARGLSFEWNLREVPHTKTGRRLN